MFKRYDSTSRRSFSHRYFLAPSCTLRVSLPLQITTAITLIICSPYQLLLCTPYIFPGTLAY